MGKSRFTSRSARVTSLAASTAAIATVLSSAPATADEQHRVQPGDTVSALAMNYSTSVQSIVRANDLNSRALIIVGQTLRIPSAGQPSSSPATAPAAAGTHRVESGDTVWSLARQYGTTVAAIIDTNGLSSSALIRIGQNLTIPGKLGTPSAAQPKQGGQAPASATVTHTVSPGDTVWDLARRYGTSVSAIIKANGLSDSAIIRIGQKLTVAGGAPVGSATASSTSSTSGNPSLATENNLSNFGSSTAEYTVVAGDTVARIADRLGSSVDAIVKANGLKNPSLIQVGQRLTVPGAVPTGLVGDSFAGRTYSAGVVGAANQNKATLNSIEVPSRSEMQAMVVATAQQMGVDPALAQAISYQESGFNMRAVSPANAIGAMQVIPSSGAWASDLVGRELNLLVPQDNVTAGIAILKHLTRGGQNLEIAIAGYYQGEAGVRKYGMYADTERYVASVLALKAKFD